MSGVKIISGGQSGSAGLHIIVLLALAVICYFGVKGFYDRIDSAADGNRDPAQQRPAVGAVEMSPAGDAVSRIDKEAITRRNLFLPPSWQQSGGSSEESRDGDGAAAADLLLVGTIMETGGDNRAVILDVEKKKQVMLSEGDMISGVSIRQISSGKVVISRQGRNELLDIAESAQIRTALMGMAPGTAAAALGTAPVAPDSSRQQTDQSEDEGLRIDLNGLPGTNNRVIVKGRVSENI